ncbi:MAG TPA: Jag N-terminal domain-containing protein, partial [Thermoanaerobaculia bacterium]
MAQRFEGRNLDEALDHAAQAFGVPRFQLTHSVILEKRGFLGGVKRIVIEVDVNDSAQPPAELVQAPAAVSAPPPPRERGGG